MCISGHTVRILVPVTLICLFSCGKTATPDAFEGVRPTRSIDEVESRLTALVSESDSLSLDVAGEVRYGEFMAPVWSVSFRPRAPIQHRVLLTAGVHGDEPAGTEALLRFIHTLDEVRGHFPATAFDIIPLVNPWGWVHGKRANGHALDINRDFTSFNAREAAIMRDFTKDKRYDLAVDLHEDDSAKGFYLYRIANDCTGLCRGIIEQQRGLGRPIEQDTWMFFLKTKDGIIFAPKWSLSLAKAARMLSMTNYLRINGNRRVFLLETPSRLPFDERLAMHKTALDALLATLDGELRCSLKR